MRLYAWAKASDLYGQALGAAEKMERLPPRRVLERHGDVSLQAGRFDAARASYETLLARQRTHLERGDTLRRLADVEYRKGNVPKGSALLKAVLSEVGVFIPRSTPALIFGIVWQTLACLPLLLFARREAKRDERLSLVVKAAMMLLEILAQESLLEGAYFQFVAMVAAERLGPSAELVRVLAQQGVVLSFFGQFGLAEHFYRRGKEIAKVAGTPWSKGIWAVAYGVTVQCEGDLARAVTVHTEADRWIAEAGDTLYLEWNWMFLADAHIGLGECAEASRLGMKMFNLADELNNDHRRAWAAYIQGRLALVRGDVSGAIETLSNAATTLEACGDHLVKLGSRSRLVMALIERGEYERALELAHTCVLERRRRRVRFPHVHVEGAFLAAAAAYRKHVGPLPLAMEPEVGAVTFWGQQVARSTRLTEPYFRAALGAIDIARGSEVRGKEKIEQALALVRERSAPSEALPIHLLAATMLDSKEHRSAAAALRERWAAPSA
jgi:tetratricopeptide (TPR) repeat protein